MRKLRPLILSVLILSLVAAGLPLSGSLAHWSRRPHVHRGHKGKKLRRRHSRAWWKRRRAWLKRRRARALARRRAVQRGRRPGRNAVASTNTSTRSRAVAMNANRKTAPTIAPPPPVAPARAPFVVDLPRSWSSTSTGPGEMKFAIRTPDGRQAGMAVLAPVSAASLSAVAAPRARMLGGVSHTALRRMVIERMITEGGWVINDVEREVGDGRRVLVVLAQTGTSANAPSQSWTFYFTELDGRIYSLATVSSVEYAAPLAADCEQIVATLRLNGAPDVAAAGPGR